MTELESIRLELERLRSVNAIQNMISTTSYMFAIGEYSTIFSFFAKRDDVTAEIADSGRHTGHDAIRGLFVDTWENYARQSAARLHETFPGDDQLEGRNGLLDLRALASPIIEVAGDGESAKGLWLIPGTQTFVPEEETLPRANWVWTKLAVDLVPEDGRWRIWHLWVVPVLAAPCGGSWVDAPADPVGNTVILSNPYDVHGTYPHPPAPPKPYQTFTDTFSY